jgi:signal transduction histidine kinase
MTLDARYRSFLGRVGSLIVIAASYFVLGKLGLRLAIVHPSATAVWPPSGISLAAILLLGYWVWPGIFVGAFAVNLTTTGSILTVTGIAFGNTLEALAGAWLVQSLAGGRHPFDTASNSLKFAALAGGLSTIIGATIGVASLIVTGYSPPTDFGRVWLTWWLGDATGDLLITPLLLLWISAWPPKWARRHILEGFIVLCTLLLAATAIFSWIGAENRAYLMELVCTPILLWTAFRLGREAAATTAVVLSSLAIWATFGGVGLFVNSSPNTELLLLQTYVAVAAIMALGVAATVWERKQVEISLQEHQRQLAQRNADLEHFAYAASHDLQEPLRTVSVFTEMMVSQYKGKLGQQADTFMEYIVGGAARMNAMVQALLTYSGVLTSERIMFSTIKLDEALHRAIKNLESAIRDSRASINFDPLPVVVGEREHLVSLFQNLIGNAIKYRSGVSPEIRIAVNQKGRDWVFSVRDNGIGIAPEYREQIFGIFKRLHGNNVSGTGIGLAISRRIVELHGGSIWVKSEVGKGSTFCGGPLG